MSIPITIDRTSMKILALKDLKLHWRAAAALVVVELVFAISLVAQFPASVQQSSGIFVQGIASIGTFVMAYRLTATEESAGVIGFLKSLPLTNDEIFLSKFVSLAIYVVLNAVALNATYLLAASALGWNGGLATTSILLGGLIIQLFFGVLLVGVATLTSSDKAIWAPFPLLILVVNGYASASSADATWLDSTLVALRQAWVFYAALSVVVLVLAALVVVRGTRRKRTLIGS